MNPSRLYEIISKVMNVPISEINDQTSPETIEQWDSFTGYILLDEIETEFNVKFTLEDTLEIKNVGDFKKLLKNQGVFIEK
jgi:acyl carrier protein